VSVKKQRSSQEKEEKMEKKGNIIKFGAGICVFLLIVTSVALGAAPQEPAKKPPVKVGIIAGITGYYAYESAAMVDGIKLAIKQFNEAGGVLGGRPIEFTVIDDRFAPDEGVSGVRRLASQGYNLFIGGISSDIALAENEVVKEKNLVMFHPVSMHPAVSKDCVAFDMNQEFTKQIEFPPTLAVEYHKPKTAAMLHENGVTGRSGIDVNKRIWGGLGVKIVAAELFEMGITEFKPVLTGINAKKPDMLYLMSAGAATLAQIVRQAREIGLKAAIDLGWTLGSQDFPDLAGKAAEGVTGVTMWVSGVDTPESKRFVEAFKKEYGRIPHLFPCVTGYEAVNFLLRGVEIAGTDTDTAKIKEGVLAVNWVGPTGRRGGIDRQTGRPKESAFIRVGIKGGTWVVLK
jgi:branched-chain amino acid transport system substrate-binding protein